MKKKIGILGGTFDPIHIGHLVTADFVMQAMDLERIIFIPAGTPPHKNEIVRASAQDRYNMTTLAISDNPNFTVSDIEILREGKTYTIDTLVSLSAYYKDSADIYFIVGTDAAGEIPTWERAKGLLNYCNIVAAMRPGYESFVDNVINFFGEAGKHKIHKLYNPELEISSTDIRDRVKHNRSFKYIVPASVELYIKREGLYRD